MRVAIRFRPEEQADAVAACLASLDGLPREAARNVSQPAPVIVVPNLLTRAQCESLIELFDVSTTIDGTVSRVGENGIAHNVVDHRKKRRRDMRIAPEDVLHRDLTDLLLRRCAPEIAKAF
jgi:hypothetical protein